MMVPAHDRRDYDFAKKYNLPIKEVIAGGNITREAFVDYGILINSGQFSGLDSQTAIQKITEWLEKNNFGKKTVNYKLRDWIFSRQHYWGEPIPIVHCPQCGAVPVPEDQLPVKLPYVEKYQPTGDGSSPLAAITDWVNTTCPQCGKPAMRETDTMPNWAGSNWYYIRYCDPHNNTALAAPDKMKYWLPVDWYNGGMEHTTLHLLYSRFIYKFLFDIGVVPTAEPYKNALRKEWFWPLTIKKCLNRAAMWLTPTILCANSALILCASTNYLWGRLISNCLVRRWRARRA